MISHTFRSRLGILLTVGLMILGASQAAAQIGGVRPSGGGGGIGGIGGIGGGGGIGGLGGGGGGGAGNINSTRSYTDATMLGDATVTADMDTRNLIVVTDARTYKVIKDIVAALDAPKPEVLIDCVFVQVSLTNELDLGAEVNYVGPVQGATQTGITQYGLGLANPSNLTVPSSSLPADLGTGLLTAAPTAGQAALPGTASSAGAFYTLVSHNINATIHALASTNKTEVLSRPSVLTRNNQQATIMVGETVPLINSSTVSTLTAQPTNTFEQEDIGIILKVTPFITKEGFVEMILDPQISSLSSQTISIGNGQTFPVIDKIQADTVVVSPNNETVVLGGLMSTQVTKTENKVPVLGDIPLLGNAFKYTTSNKQKTELIMFLTPHIIYNPNELSNVSLKEKNEQDYLDKKDFDKNDQKMYGVQ